MVEASDYGDELNAALRSMQIMAERIRDQDTEIERLKRMVIQLRQPYRNATLGKSK